MAENLTTDFSEIPVVAYNVELQMQIPWQQILFVLFVVGFAFVVTRYLIGLAQLRQIIRKSEKQTLADNSVLYVTEQDVSPFSWFNRIVLSRNDMNVDNRAIINHERAHIRLLHSLDMIFFDLFTCLFWFNPSRGCCVKCNRFTSIKSMIQLFKWHRCKTISAFINPQKRGRAQVCQQIIFVNAICTNEFK